MRSVETWQCELAHEQSHCVRMNFAFSDQVTKTLTSRELSYRLLESCYHLISPENSNPVDEQMLMIQRTTFKTEFREALTLVGMLKTYIVVWLPTHTPAVDFSLSPESSSVVFKL